VVAVGPLLTFRYHGHNIAQRNGRVNRKRYVNSATGCRTLTLAVYIPICL
jgi:hypothetical protein